MYEKSEEELGVERLVKLAQILNAECGYRVADDKRDPFAGFACDQAKLESAISAPLQVIWDVPRYTSAYDTAAALLVHLVRAHAFQDGNKRTSLKIALTYLKDAGIIVATPSPAIAADLVEWTISCTDRDIDDVIKYVANIFIDWTVGGVPHL